MPERYIFQDPDTQHIYKALTKEDLFRQIVNYRVQNRLSPIDALDLVLESYWCSLPENLGRCRIVRLQRSWEKVKRGGIVLLKNLLMGPNALVPQLEAERRAAICADCPQNVFPDKGPFNQWADDIALKFVGKRQVSINDDLGNCAVCTCVLRVKVFTRGPFELTRTEFVQLPSFCWQRDDPKITKA